MSGKGKKKTTKKQVKFAKDFVEYDGEVIEKKPMSREEQNAFVKETGIKKGAIGEKNLNIGSRTHVEKVGDLTIRFSDAKPYFDASRFRDSDRKAQAKRILKYSGMADFNVKPKTFLQVVTDNCRDVYANIISGIKGDDKIIRKKVPYATFIKTLVRTFLNITFGEEPDANYTEENVKNYMKVLKKSPDTEKQLMNDFLSMVNEEDMQLSLERYAKDLMKTDSSDTSDPALSVSTAISTWMRDTGFKKERYQKLLVGNTGPKTKWPVNRSQTPEI